MTRTRLLIALSAAFIVVTAAGCSSTSPRPSRTTTSGIDASATTSGDHPAIAPDPSTVVTITIAGGTVTPTNAEIDAVVGQPIVVNVSSDAPDSIHVHSVPAHVFDVQVRPDQRFEFTVDVPGQVDVELHELNRTIVTIVVRPR